MLSDLMSYLQSSSPLLQHGRTRARELSQLGYGDVVHHGQLCLQGIEAVQSPEVVQTPDDGIPVVIEVRGFAGAIRGGRRRLGCETDILKILMRGTLRLVRRKKYPGKTPKYVLGLQ